MGRAADVAGGIDGLIDLVDRFGPEIEYDLHHELGVDILDFFRGRWPWSKLLRLIARLPDHGHYKAALAHDESNPAMWALLAQRAPDPAPTMLGWTREVALLVGILEAVHQVSGVTIAVNTESGHMPEPVRIPRPVTALQKFQQRRKVDDREARMRVLVPHTFDQEPQPDSS